MRISKIVPIVFFTSAILFSQFIFAHPIDSFYETHKNDTGMESKKIPPKLASLMIDDDYPEAKDILKSLRSLKYLNFYGDESKIQNYGKSASSKKGSYKEILNIQEGTRFVRAFGVTKRKKVKKIIVVVETSVQFILIIAKGSLSEDQINYLPALTKEIQ